MSGAGLPDGRLLSWYGDDFTGSAAVMEVLSFGGLPSVLFLAPPTETQLARFPQARAVGIAGTARSRSPAWMDAHLPEIFAALAALHSPITHYKVCSTLDSAPDIGSIGHAIDLAATALPSRWFPVLIAAPVMGRYQAFSNLFAASGDAVHRLDRHPVMRRHPVTPMHEADIRLHLARQTQAGIGGLELPQLRSADGGDAALAALLARGERIVTLDAVDAGDMAAAGRLMWQTRGSGLFAVGSQGVEYALLEHWRDAGLVDPVAAPSAAEPLDRIVVVSGSVSQTTADQIAWAAAHGFRAIAFDVASVVDPARRDGAVSDAVRDSLRAVQEGQSPLIHTALGPDDPAVPALREAVARASLTTEDAFARIGTALGDILDQVLDLSGLDRAVISGGDTSGHACAQLGIFALTALAQTIPGATLCRAHRETGAGFELALKGGQMGSTDYFGWIRAGGGGR